MAGEKRSKERDRLELLLEEIRDKVNVIAEGHSVLDRKIDTVAEKLSEEIGAVRQELRQEIRAVRSELKSEIDITSRALGYEIKLVGSAVEEVRVKLEEHIRV
jgi:archaellum component FlaC